jgi:hypothetical protein
MEAAPEGLEREHPVEAGMSAPWSSVVLRGRKLLRFLRTTEHGAPRSISTAGTRDEGTRAQMYARKDLMQMCSVSSVLRGQEASCGMASSPYNSEQRERFFAAKLAVSRPRWRDEPSPEIRQPAAVPAPTRTSFCGGPAAPAVAPPPRGLTRNRGPPHKRSDTRYPIRRS